MDNLVKTINEGSKVIRRCIKYFKGADTIQHIAETVRHQVDEFKPLVPLIQTLKNNGMRQRHWEAISDACGKLCFECMKIVLIIGFILR